MSNLFTQLQRYEPGWFKSVGERTLKWCDNNVLGEPQYFEYPLCTTPRVGRKRSDRDTDPITTGMD